MLDEELSWLLGEAAMGALPSRAARFLPGANVGVVLAAGGYPEAVETGQPITGIDAAAAVPDALVFHAGTSKREGQLVTSGGRVLTVVGRGQNFGSAIDTAYRAAACIRFEGMQFRRDIGRKALSECEVLSIITFGCRVNQADSLAIARDLHARGAVEAPPREAELVVVNTCSVTAAADQGVRQTVRRVVRDNPGARIVVTGCYATRRPDEIRQLPNVAHIVSNDEKDDLVERLSISIGLPRPEEVTTAARYGGGDGPCGDTLSPGAAGRTALTLRVQTGCDEACSYCIIPRTTRHGTIPAADRRDSPDRRCSRRRLSRNRDRRGAPRVVRARPRRRYDISRRLVRVLAEWKADVLFRISSLEPMDCTPEIVDLVASSPRLAPHFHLPLQHGADEILRAMRRPYTASAYVRARVADSRSSAALRRLAPISSSAFRESRPRSSRRPKHSCAICR